MARSLQPRDRRALQRGLVALLLVVAVGLSPRVLDRLGRLRREVRLLRSTLSPAGESHAAQQAGLWHRVPVFQMPGDAEAQKVLLRERLAEQFKKAGLKEEPFEVDRVPGRRVGGFGVLILETRGKGQFKPLLDLLADLKANPVYAAVEALTIRCDPKQEPAQRREIEYELTLSTLVTP